MNNDEVISRTADYIKQRFEAEGTGHDWWHIYRVWELSKRIAATEKSADIKIVELSALLHDIADWKFHDDEEAGPKAARKWLEPLKVEENTIIHIEDIVRNISFKGAKVKNNLRTIEGQIIHDADKLDAIGAIGIARAFMVGGHWGRLLYDPDRKPKLHKTFRDFKNDKTDTINHFYEKLLLLKDRMYTNSGKEMAEHRHEFMEKYLKEFYAEWEGIL